MDTGKSLELSVQSLLNTAIQKHQLGELNEAEFIYRQVLQGQPSVIEEQDIKKQFIFTAISNLGTVLQQQGKLNEAIQAYRQALELKPDFVEVYYSLGNALSTQGKLDEAIQAYQQALALKPDVETYCTLGNALKKQGKLDEAIQAYQQALEIDSEYDRAKFAVVMSQLPTIYSSSDEIQSQRHHYQHHLQQLARSYRATNEEKRAKAAEAVGSIQPFYLTYQCLNDRHLQQIYGEMICQLMASRYPQWSQPVALPPLEANEKIRVGFVSRFFHAHSIWKIPIKGWMQNLDIHRFKLFGYHTGSKQDRETAIAAQACFRFVSDSLPLEEWCEIIAQDKLHVIVFTELGMDPMTARLSCLRLAPIQIVSWAHPNTSGQPTIDYYLSSDLMEPDNGQDYYIEKLVRLPNLSTDYNPLKIQPKAVDRREIGIEEHEIMFWCCQSLYKYLPQHDDIFPKIAKELVNCKFVFLTHDSEEITKVFSQRLRLVFQKFGLNYQDYCIFLPRSMDSRTFAGTTAIADVYLDSIGWSGCNTTLDAIAYDVPVVTLPGKLMRGRHTMAILKMMGIEEAIASSKADYVNIAVRFGRDPHYRQSLSEKIAENKHKLIGDLRPIKALEDFLIKAIDKKKEVGMATVSEVLGLAFGHHRAHRLDQAEQCYRQILETRPHTLDALYGLGVLSQQRGQFQVAQELLEAALDVQPESVRVWFSLGNLRQAQGQLPEAVEAYQQALAIQPSAAIYNNLGNTRQKQEKLDEAIACFRKALETQPDCTEADANHGNVLFAQGKLAPEKQIHYAALNNKLGETCKQAGDLTNAVAYYQQAIAMQPESAIFHYNLGVALQEQGQQEAISCYQKALALDPGLGEAYISLGKIYQQQNKLEESASAFRQGLKLINPHYAQAVAVHQESATTPEERVPPLKLGEVVVGEHRFPAIPPVSVGEDKRPFWSVIIPLDNHNHFRLECLASVLAQWSGEEMEILVMDNASTPPLFELSKAIGGGIVRYYHNPQIGAQHNFNLGIALCRGHWVHVLHEDDCVLPDFYSRLKQRLEALSDCVGAAFTDYESINEKGKVISSQQHPGLHQGINQDWLWRIGVSNPLNFCAVVIRRAAYERLGGYDQQNLCTGGWELYKRIAVFYDWWYEPEILACFRQQADNRSNAVSAEIQRASYRQAIEISATYLPAEYSAEITAKARSHYFHYCLEQAAISLQVSNVTGALRLVQEALKNDNSSQAVAELFAWLSREELAPLQHEIISTLTSLPLQTNADFNLTNPIRRV